MPATIVERFLPDSIEFAAAGAGVCALVSKLLLRDDDGVAALGVEAECGRDELLHLRVGRQVLGAGVEHDRATDCRVTVPVAFCVSSSCSLGTTVEVSAFFS